MKILINLAVAIIAVASATDEQANTRCQIECTKIRLPVCGYDPTTNQYKDFTNVCEMRRENCLQRADYYPKIWGRCVQPKEASLQSNVENNERCQIECPKIRLPVCGYDTKTNQYKEFENVCEMRRENCLQRADYYPKILGPCVQPKEASLQSNVENNERCQIECPKIRLPVCGYDTKTNQYKEFENVCEMRRENCLQRADYYPKKWGRCISPKEAVAPTEDENNDY